jgi:hypothetical protein
VSLDAARTELSSCCDTIEECYEYMLAYAAQGITSEGSQIRDFLGRSDKALAGLIEFVAGFASQQSLASPYTVFMGVIERDARDALAAVRLVLAQSTIGSPLVDNLNGSIHLRALLTDLFLFDEALKQGGAFPA